jgi:predicted membrane chloride channel (bestrophin family)
MANDYEEKRKKTNRVLRSIYDYVAGVLWFSLGAFFLLHKKFRIELDFDPTLITIFGIAAVLYGGFRIYRGYKKNYFK